MSATPKPLTYGTVCSGIGAPEVALSRLGWIASFCSEISPFPSAVLAHRFPNVPNLGDFTKIDHEKIQAEGCPAIDVLVGGPPCQDWSGAGKGAGMAGDNGRLTFEYVGLVSRLRPRWVVFENVPALLDSTHEQAFGKFLGSFAGRDIDVPAGGWGNAGCVSGIEDAYDLAWRVVDARYFGVAQRRRRVFVVGHLAEVGRRLHRDGVGDSGRFPNMAAAVLFEWAGLSGHPFKGKEAKEEAAGVFRGGAEGGGGEQRCFRYVNADAGCVETSQAATLKASGVTTDERTLSVVVVEVGHSEYSEAGLPCLRASRGECGGGSECYVVQGSENPAALPSEKPECVALSARQCNAEILLNQCPTLTCLHEAPIVAVPEILALQLAQTGGNGDNMSVMDFPTVDTTAGSIGVCYGCDEEINVGNELMGTLLHGPQGSPRQCVCYGFKGGQGADAGSLGMESETSPTLTASQSGSNMAPTVIYALDSELNGAENLAGPVTTGNLGGQFASVCYPDTGTAYGFHGDASITQTMNLAEEGVPTLDKSKKATVMSVNGGPISGTIIRRLVPMECAKLQGFPPGHTMVPWRGKTGLAVPWTPQYHAIGNAMAVPVLEWLGRRIGMVQAEIDLILNTEK